MTNYETSNLKNVLTDMGRTKLFYSDHFTVILENLSAENDNKCTRLQVEKLLEEFRNDNKLMREEEYKRAMLVNNKKFVKWECPNKNLQRIYIKMIKCRIADFAGYGGAVNMACLRKDLNELTSLTKESKKLALIDKQEAQNGSFKRAKKAKQLYRDLHCEMDLVKAVMDYKINSHKNSEAVLNRYKDKATRKESIATRLNEEKIAKVIEVQARKEEENEKLKDGRKAKIAENKLKKGNTQDYNNVMRR